ncbi:MAG: CdaR family protein [Romboutsia sp.]
MINQLKNNTRIKLISLLSAIVLWLYVMAVVDPEESKIFENLPIEISNMSQLKENDLVIYPEIELTSDITITGKRSSLQKLKKESIHVYGQINDPMEGKKDMYLKANVPGKVTHEFKSNIKIINLEKIVKEKRTIDINIEGKLKNNIEPVTLDKDNVKISGPRVLVNKVQKVVGTVNTGNETTNFSSKVKLVPVDIDGKEVEGVDLEKSTINVNIILLKEKTVPIKVKFTNNNEIEDILKNYEVSQRTINIKGKKDIVDKIDSISTKAVDLESITENTSKDIYLEIPEGIIVDSKYITIKLDIAKNIITDLTYNSQDVQLRNKSEGIDISKIKIPDVIKVSIEHADNIEAPIKSDIILYIDFNKLSDEEGIYSIEYETQYITKQITVDPKVTNVYQ